MKIIKLLKTGNRAGEYLVQVDDSDYEALNKKAWWVSFGSTKTYASVTISKKSHSMHRIILGITDPNTFVDHIDGNGLNNQRSNLRCCTNKQNCANRSSKKNSTSIYLGVYKHCTQRKYLCKNGNVKIYKSIGWQAKVTTNGGGKYLGCFKSEIEAAKAYDEGARKYHGEFANLNFK